MKKTIITIDFDGVLSETKVQEKVLTLLTYCNVDVFILTSRYDDLHKHLYPLNPTNEDLYSIANALKIPRSKIIFTNGEKKSKYLKKTFVDYHFDNDYEEIRRIRNQTKTKGFHVSEKMWHRYFDWLLDNL